VFFASAGIYDQGKLQQLLASKGKQAAPEFFDPPSCPFYEVCGSSSSSSSSSSSRKQQQLSMPLHETIVGCTSLVHIPSVAKPAQQQQPN
jgi:hypothetical protein